jgi:hypothetical protein
MGYIYIYIYTYVEKKSLNEYMWTKLNKKQREKEMEK